MRPFADVDVVTGGLLAAAVLAFGGLTYTRKALHRLEVLRVIAIGGIGFQVVHFVEHMLQVGYWTLHRNDTPWFTPWAAWARDVLAHGMGSQAEGGTELLHLLGNGLFLAGVLALAAIGRRRGATGPALRGAITAQALHTYEHVVLTATWVVGGEALGFTNLYGLLPGGGGGTSTRIWVHFVLNLVATVYAVAAVREMLGKQASAATAAPRKVPPHQPGVQVTPRR